MRLDKNQEVFKHKHICLVEDHDNPLSIVRSLGEEGIRPIVLMFGNDIHLVPSSRYVGEVHKFATKEDAFSYLLTNYGNEPRKPFIYNGSDDVTLLLDKHYEELKDKFYFTHGYGGLGKYLQKYDITQLAKECGVDIPKEELLDVGVMPTTLRYPVFTKATTSASGGQWKAQAFICHSPEELKNVYDKIKAKKILVQEYIEKKNELCIDGISINGGEEVFMPYGCGYYRFVPGNYGHYMKFTPFVDKDLTEKIRNIIREAHFTGIFCIEFMVGQNNELYFLEVNFRHSGWGYAFTYGGFNLPLRWAVSTLDNKLWLDGFKYLKSFDFMAEIAYLRECLKYWHYPLIRYFKEFCNCDCHLLWNRCDMMPVVAEIWSTVKGMFKKKLGAVVTSFLRKTFQMKKVMAGWEIHR